MSYLLRWYLLFATLLLMAPVQACLWDSDTLATEAKGLPDVVQIITGRFERNPPLFYEMRLARVTNDLKTQPSKLELYDDAAVACDRLHRDTEAIAWMKQKRAHLRAFPQDKEQWYRYHANLGTFLAHDWLRSGANRKNLGQMKLARDHIDAAIQINPDAHFGREKYQLMAMDWIINPPKAQKSDGEFFAMPSFVERDESMDSDEKNGISKALSGLIVLGDAWESLDIFVALRNSMKQKNASIAYLAALRAVELAKDGRKSLYPGAPTGKTLVSLVEPKEFDVMLTPERRPVVAQSYHQLRAEAQKWQAKRRAYMIERLNMGRHPDSDANFWNEWHHSGPPPIYDIPTQGDILRRQDNLKLAFLSVCLVGLFIVVWRIIVKRHRHIAA